MNIPLFLAIRFLYLLYFYLISSEMLHYSVFESFIVCDYVVSFTIGVTGDTFILIEIAKF